MTTSIWSRSWKCIQIRQCYRFMLEFLCSDTLFTPAEKFRYNLICLQQHFDRSKLQTKVTLIAMCFPIEGLVILGGWRTVIITAIKLIALSISAGFISACPPVTWSPAINCLMYHALESLLCAKVLFVKRSAFHFWSNKIWILFSLISQIQ